MYIYTYEFRFAKYKRVLNGIRALQNTCVFIERLDDI